jgi:hypothetical protein
MLSTRFVHTILSPFTMYLLEDLPFSSII